MRRFVFAVIVSAACGESYGAEPAATSPDGGTGATDAGSGDAGAVPSGARCSASAPFANAHVISVSGLSPAGGVLLPDEKTMFFMDDVTPEAGTDYRLLVTTRPSRTEPFAAPSMLNELMSPTLRDSDPAVTGDGLMMIFRRDTSSSTQADLFIATRLSTGLTFSTPQKLSLSTDGADEISPYLMSDAHALWYSVHA